MSMVKSILAIVGAVVVVMCLVTFEVRQVYAACLCMCSAVSSVPSSVHVTNYTNPGCQASFSYTYKVHYGTNDDNCGSGRTVYCQAYSDPTSCSGDEKMGKAG